MYVTYAAPCIVTTPLNLNQNPCQHVDGLPSLTALRGVSSAGGATVACHKRSPPSNALCLPPLSHFHCLFVFHWNLLTRFLVMKKAFLLRQPRTSLDSLGGTTPILSPELHAGDM